MQKLTKLQQIYDSLPTMKCKGLCQSFCGPIKMSRLEEKRIEKESGISMEMNMEKLVETVMTAATCPQLDHSTGRCSIYAIRPLICRVFGMIKRLKCPHGCEPSKWLTDKEFRAIALKIEKLEK